jgi:hypothetical protein
MARVLRGLVGIMSSGGPEGGSEALEACLRWVCGDAFGVGLRWFGRGDVRIFLVCWCLRCYGQMSGRIHIVL